MAKIGDILKPLIQPLMGLLDYLALAKGKQNMLYTTAVGFLGRDASPSDIAPDEVGCMESVSKILQKAFPELNFPTIVSTKAGFDHLRSSPSFLETSDDDYGVIIISVTGTGNGKIEHGHIGICGKYFSPDGTPWVLSNDSRTGTFEANWTVGGWMRYYRDKGALSTFFFRVV